MWASSPTGTTPRTRVHPTSPSTMRGAPADSDATHLTGGRPLIYNGRPPHVLTSVHQDDLLSGNLPNFPLTGGPVRISRRQLGLAAAGTLAASVPFIVIESAGAATRLDLTDPRMKEIAMELVSSAENSSLNWKA